MCVYFWDYFTPSNRKKVGLWNEICVEKKQNTIYAVIHVLNNVRFGTVPKGWSNVNAQLLCQSWGGDWHFTVCVNPDPALTIVIGGVRWGLCGPTMSVQSMGLPLVQLNEFFPISWKCAVEPVFYNPLVKLFRSCITGGLKLWFIAKVKG